ncbi:hypothetical protein EDD18DRAFT_568484 [Armillaria luteobubalina]|uniref:Uncharacterized protein n=1 Tax=Armillaria luteobubalina TaxID=153913 RepID=A0AA39UMZ0_9AGAR|nr:hypothetical protein EDD18DRAFT_568484 [Armillaria luteobubalina]
MGAQASTHRLSDGRWLNLNCYSAAGSLLGFFLVLITNSTVHIPYYVEDLRSMRSTVYRRDDIPALRYSADTEKNYPNILQAGWPASMSRLGIVRRRSFRSSLFTLCIRSQYFCLNDMLCLAAVTIVLEIQSRETAMTTLGRAKFFVPHHLNGFDYNQRPRAFLVPKISAVVTKHVCSVVF